MVGPVYTKLHIEQSKLYRLKDQDTQLGGKINSILLLIIFLSPSKAEQTSEGEAHCLQNELMKYR